MVSAAPLVQVAEVVKNYHRGPETVHALRSVSMTLRPGEMVGLAGPSGSGKSTLLNTICGWERPDAGTVRLNIRTAGRAAAAEAPDPATVPWSVLALIPQALGLIDDLSAGQNVALPARLEGDLAGSRDRALELMRRLGVDQLAARYPSETSLGEQQRCAIARALLLHPALIIADEPTAHQDHGWTDVVFDMFAEHAASGAAVIVSTHNRQLWPRCDRLLRLVDGELAGS